ncbi:MAG TPA: tRNA-dihydrouridine synthase family protein [Geobacteraceae bacterium]|nr:tRNA-dihydrouridine synthase family protein [Geobacteraceae bacterium]
MEVVGSADPAPSASLPWSPGQTPLMLAPMQGVTNRAMRSLFIDWVRPDLVFTEFMRINATAPIRRFSAAVLREVGSHEGDVPLVVQLIGHGREALVAAARTAQSAGAVHINLNMGCPYGRMTSGLTGGGMLKRPADLAEIIPALRDAVSGTFSVKLRAGYNDPEQVFSLLPLFESARVDFIVLHPRTVVQAYTGRADHAITSEVVRRTTLPVIANGDIRSSAAGLQVLRETSATGLMLGRGAIADPLLFERLRGRAAAEPDREERAAQLHNYLRDLLARYREQSCGDSQVLGKLKGVLATMDDPCFKKHFKEMLESKELRTFSSLLDGLE